MPRPPHPLRFEFESALLAYVETKGEDFERSALVQSYVDRGVNQSTVYRWIETVLANRAVSPRRMPAGHYPPAAPPTVDDQPPMVVETLPLLPRIEDVKANGLVPVHDLLLESIEQARNLMRHAREPDGKIRNARLLLRASDYLRRAVETASKLNATQGMEHEIQRFQSVVMEEIGREPPEVQQRVLLRIRRQCDSVLTTNSSASFGR